MTEYNYTDFSTDDYDFDSTDGVKLGGKAPDFRLNTAQGQQRNLLDFSGDFLVLEMGSITCPLFQSRRAIMQPLEQEFASVSSAVLYVREAHPGSDIPAHSSLEAKTACATRLMQQDGETRTIFIDDFDGRAHKAYGSMPNAVFIINKHGCVVFRADWNNPSATRKALTQLINKKTVTAKSYFRPAVPKVVFHTLGNAGKGSALDFFKGLPYLIWVNIVKRNLKLLFGRDTRFSADTRC